MQAAEKRAGAAEMQFIAVVGDRIALHRAMPGRHFGIRAGPAFRYSCQAPVPKCRPGTVR
jgi:hypothetical protein